MKNTSFLNKYTEYCVYIFWLMYIMSFVFFFYDIVMISADDVAYEGILSGTMTGKPSAYCWFLQYPLSLVISQFYYIFPNIGWYRVFLLACHAVCYFLIFCRAKNYKGQKKVYYILFATVIIFLLCLEYMIHLEWSSTAGILGATAIFRYITMPITDSKRSQIVEYTICLILVVTGYCIRSQIIMLYMPLAFFCWLKRSHSIYQSCEKKINKKSIKELLAEADNKLVVNFGFLGAVGISVLIVIIIHSVAYSGEEWKAYKEYTVDRSVLVDYYGYPSYSEYKDEYEKAGISREMYSLMVNDYNYVMPFEQADKIDLSSIANISEKNNSNKSISDKIVYIHEKIQGLIGNDRFIVAGIVLLLSIIYLLVRMFNTSLESMLYYASTLLWFAIVLVFLASKGRLPIRIGITLIFGICAVVLGDIYNMTLVEKEHFVQYGVKKNVKTKKIPLIFSLVLLLSVMIMNLFDVHLENKNYASLAIAKNQIVEYCAKNPDGLYLRDFISFSQYGSLFFENVGSANYISTGGWLYNTPVYDQMLEENNVDTIIKSVKSGKKIYYLVSSKRSDEVESRIMSYLSTIDSHVEIKENERFSTVQGTVVVYEFVYLDSNHYS